MKKNSSFPYLLTPRGSTDKQMVFALCNCLYENTKSDLLPFPLTVPNEKRKC